MSYDSKISIFYQHSNINIVINNDNQTSILRSGSSPIAEIASGSAPDEAALLSVDTLGTPVSVARNEGPLEKVFSPYGYASTKYRELSFIGFAGELPIAEGKYLLGSFRIFDPALMRFHSPDNLSPFVKGGINTYSYCENDPINNADPSGHFRIRSLLGHTFRPKLPAYISTRNNTSLPAHISTQNNTSPPPFNEAIKPKYDPRPPNYEEALQIYPAERNNIINTTSLPIQSNSKRIKKLHTLADQYNSYINQQENKYAFESNQARYNYRSANRVPYGSDLWIHYQTEARINGRHMRHYADKIATITREQQALQDYLTNLRRTQ